MNFIKPYCYDGIGSDIKWCGKWTGGKRCMLCHKYEEFGVWSKTWHWNYLLWWRRMFNWGKYSWTEHSHFRLYAEPGEIKPDQYKTVGLDETRLFSLLKNGCKPNRKCRCASVAQRGNWYCPKCHEAVTKMATHRRVTLHDIIMSDREELKKDILILTLSGTLQERW